MTGAGVNHDGMCSLALSRICDCDCHGRRHGERYTGKLGPDRRDLTFASPVLGSFVEDEDLECLKCKADLFGLPILRVRKWSVVWNGVAAKKGWAFVLCEDCEHINPTEELGLVSV